MKIPKIIFHGTNHFRWLLIQRSWGFRSPSNVPKIYQTDDSMLGYTCFTSDVQNACMYGLGISLRDTSPTSRLSGLGENPLILSKAMKFRDPVVIGLKTSNLKAKIEIDPALNDPCLKNALRSLKEQNIKWYRIAGDIPLKYLFDYQFVPFDSIDPAIIERMQKVDEKNTFDNNMKALSYVLDPQNKILEQIKQLVDSRGGADTG